MLLSNCQHIHDTQKHTQTFHHWLFLSWSEMDHFQLRNAPQLFLVWSKSDIEKKWESSSCLYKLRPRVVSVEPNSLLSRSAVVIGSHRAAWALVWVWRMVLFGFSNLFSEEVPGEDWGTKIIQLPGRGKKCSTLHGFRSINSFISNDEIIRHGNRVFTGLIVDMLWKCQT